MSEDSEEQAELAKAIDRLLERLEKIGGGGWIPQWLADVGTKEEVAQWQSICKVYHGLDRQDRIQEFVHAMRKKYPNMAKGFEEQLEEEVRKLKENPDLARAEGIPEEYIRDHENEE